MEKTRADFAVETKNGIVKRIGRSTITVPKTNFSGGSVKWLKDKPKKISK